MMNIESSTNLTDWGFFHNENMQNLIFLGGGGEDFWKIYHATLSIYYLPQPHSSIQVFWVKAVQG